jgi:thioredoxin reductase
LCRAPRQKLRRADRRRGGAGYAAALYAARYRLDTVVAGAAFGGETATSGQIENYPGVPDVDGFDLMLRFAEQVERQQVELVEQNVASIERDDACFRSVLADGSTIRSAAVVLAIGRARRTLGLEHEQEWTGRGVSYCSTCDPPLSLGKVVAVVRGGNSAAEGALLNARYAERVYLIVRAARLGARSRSWSSAS